VKASEVISVRIRPNPLHLPEAERGSDRARRFLGAVGACRFEPWKTSVTSLPPVRIRPNPLHLPEAECASGRARRFLGAEGACGFEPCQSQRSNEVRATVWLRFESARTHFLRDRLLCEEGSMLGEVVVDATEDEAIDDVGPEGDE